MASIGGILQAVLDETPISNSFIGFFPNYRAFHEYSSVGQPSLLSKGVRIKTMTVAALWALEKGEFHELAVEVVLGERKIATGRIADGFTGQELSNSEFAAIS